MADEFDYTPDLIHVSDDDGKEYIFEILDRVETDDGRYVAVIEYYEDPKEQLEDDGEVIILKVTEENGDSYLSQIESEEEYEQIAEIFDERLSELFDEDGANAAEGE